MIRSYSRVLSPQGFQIQVESEFMSTPVPPSTSSGVVSQTHEYKPPISTDEYVINPFSVTHKYTFLLGEVQQQLYEIRQEAEEAFSLDSEIDPIPESAYDDAFLLLQIFFHLGIPLPDISWAEDGSLSLGWYPEEGIVTMGIYGDNLIIYTAFFEEKRQLEGICELSDTILLSGFLTILVGFLF